MTATRAVRAFWWLVAREVVDEARARRAWPGMLLLGLILVGLLGMQTDLPPRERQQVVGGALWLAVFFAGTLALERSFAGDREDGCWRMLFLYPVPPAVIFLAKVAVCCVALTMLECVLVPAFAVVANTPLLDRPVSLAAVALLGNVGFAAVGVLTGALTTGHPQRGGLLALLLLPLVAPVMLAAAEATRLLAVGDVGDGWWRWLQLLAAFAVLFTAVGSLMFEFTAED